MKKMPAVKQVFQKILKKDLSAQEGATLIEIALYIALVVIVCIAVVASLGGKLQGVFTTIVNSL